MSTRNHWRDSANQLAAELTEAQIDWELRFIFGLPRVPLGDVDPLQDATVLTEATQHAQEEIDRAILNAPPKIREVDYADHALFEASCGRAGRAIPEAMRRLWLQEHHRRKLTFIKTASPEQKREAVARSLEQQMAEANSVSGLG